MFPRAVSELRVCKRENILLYSEAGGGQVWEMQELI